MTRIGIVRTWAVLSGLFAGVLIPGPAWAQPAIAPGFQLPGYILFLDGRFLLVAASLSGPAQEQALDIAWPDPMRPRASIPFRLSEAADIRIDIWDLSGRQVRQLDGAGTPAGEHQMTWDGRDGGGLSLPHGTYFYRMAINGRSVAGAGKALLLR